MVAFPGFFFATFEHPTLRWVPIFRYATTSCGGNALAVSVHEFIIMRCSALSREGARELVAILGFCGYPGVVLSCYTCIT